MLLRFGLENHRSIRDYQEISLVATKLKDREAGLLPLSSDSSLGDPLSVVPVVALYGANASGKTTVLEGLRFFVDGIVSSHSDRNAGDRTPYLPFMLDDDSREKPARYDADFVLDGVRYHYGYSLDGKRILAEWLYSIPVSGARKVKSVLFQRDSDESEEFYFGKSLKGENRQIAKLVRSNSLFLSAAAQNSHPQLTPLYKFFSEKVTKRFTESFRELLPEQLVTYFSQDDESMKAALTFLGAADVGIVGMDFSRVPLKEHTKKFITEFEKLMASVVDDQSFRFPNKSDQAQVKLVHRGIGSGKYELPMESESAGTISLLGLLGPLLLRLKQGGLLIVDELNSTLHPLVSRKLIELFSSHETNPVGSQLIFSTHDTNLLSSHLLRRDQVWFSEKDNEGATHVYSMAEIKVRASDNLENGYLQGRFGAVPFLACDLSPASEGGDV